ncbi:hypothetical protein O9992_00230 [Vibrio lentus]|nr:hypothetical protein [Vibrio lentus]
MAPDYEIPPQGIDCQHSNSLTWRKLSPELKPSAGNEGIGGRGGEPRCWSIRAEHWILQLISQKDAKLMALCESQKLSLDALVKIDIENLIFAKRY